MQTDTNMLHSIHLTTKRTLTVDGTVNGVALLNDMIYVIYEKSNVISVFNSNSTTASDQFVIEELQAPRDVAASELNQCIYISDNMSGVVWKIDIKLPRTATKWFYERSPYTLYAGPDDTLLVTKYNENRLSLYDHYGRYEKIELRENLQAMHAVVKSNGNILVAYTKLEDNNCSWYVGEFDENLDEINCYGPQTGPVKYTKYLTVIRKGKIDIATLLADGDSNTVLRLGGSLQMDHNNPQNDTLIELPHHPNRILYDEKSNELLISQCNGMINIYSIEHSPFNIV